MILDERHSIAAVSLVASQATVGQLAPVVTVAGIAHTVAGGEVKSRRLYHPVHLRIVQPILQGRHISVPILTHREGSTHRRVIQSGIFGRIALRHVIAEAGIAKVILQEVQVSHHIVLHILARVVQVAHSTPVLTRVIGTGHVISLGRVSAIIVLADVGQPHLISHPLVRLSREVHPRTTHAHRATMVDDHVSNHPHTLLLVGLNHRAQLLLGAKGRVLVVPIDRRIPHHIVRRVAVSTLRHPQEVEILGHLVRFTLQVRPLGIHERVPKEPLQHHTAIVGRPSLSHHHKRHHQGKNSCRKTFHSTVSY